MRLALLIEYDGTDFAGWQIQPNARTVQAELETALSSLYHQKINLIGAGRTDSGVHASGMVAHFEVPPERSIRTFNLIEALNTTTGYDVVVHDAREVPDDFHARFSATSRAYEYTIAMHRVAIDRRRTWWMHNRSLDFDLLQQCAKKLIGEHDFTSFSKNSPDVGHYRCQISLCEWKTDGMHFALRIQANRFVRGLVRGLVGAMVEVGRKRLSVDEFTALLEQPQEVDRARFLAPAHGLVLTGVGYPQQFNLW